MSVNAVPNLEIEGARATICLRRPREHNRIDPSDLNVLLEHFERVASDKAVRVLVLTGTGHKTFSSGYTISAIREHLDDRWEKALDTLEALPIPVVCALNGDAYGGAIDLAMCCDFRIGVRGSRASVPAAKFGIHYYPGGIRRYVTRLGLDSAKKLLLTAQTIDAEEMFRIGLLTELVDRAELDALVTRYIDAIIVCERGVVASMKRDLNRTADGRADVAGQRDAYERSLRSDELARRLSALAAR